MLKRNASLFIKLLLVILLMILVIFILRGADTVNAQSEGLATKYTANYDTDITKEYLAQIQASIAELEELESRVASDLAHYVAWEEEYYYATKTWSYLRQRGFNQAVTCGIIGNMMIETSGGTLDLKPNIYSPSGNFYGLCQWSRKYYPSAHGLPFDYQLDYLLGSMQWEFNTFGKYYKEDFSYEDFLKITDPSEAALAFAKVYERCGPASYEMRQEAAKKAYEYFDLNSTL